MSEINITRLELLEAIVRVRLGSTHQSSGRLSVKAVADEAGIGRHCLTQQNRDIETFVKLLSSDYKVAQGKVADPILKNLRLELAQEKKRSSVLAAQITVLLAAQSFGDDKKGVRLRPV